MGKKKKYTEDELRKLDQGERLAKLRSMLGYKTRTTFAISINYSASTIDAVEDYKRPISNNLLQAIDKVYEGRYDKNWLVKGQQFGLLTIKKEDDRQNLEEPVQEYKCKLCDKKDRQIRILNEELNSLRKDYIICLKELSGLKKTS
jgi:hypothetical protein